MNIHSLKKGKIKKFSEFYSIINEHVLEITLLQEHWRAHINQVPKLKNYTMKSFKEGYTKRTKQICGGMLMFILNVKWIEIKHINRNSNVIMNNKCKILIINVYIPIHVKCYLNEIQNTFLDIDVLITLYEQQAQTIIIAGDFNA